MNQIRRMWLAIPIVLLLLAGLASGQDPGAPRPPSDVQAADYPLDGGEKVEITWLLSPDDPDNVLVYRISRSLLPEEREKVDEDDRAKTGQIARGLATRRILGLDWDGTVASIPADQLAEIRAAREQAAAAAEAAYTPSDGWKFLGTAKAGETSYTADQLERGVTYRFKVEAQNAAGATSVAVEAPNAVGPALQWFHGGPSTVGGKFWLAIVVFIICGAVIYFIEHARAGKDLKVRTIAGLEAVDEAVGRATEMGRSILFVPGVQDMNDIQTIAGITVLSRVAKTAASYDASVEVPTSRSLVMTTARETVQAAFLAAGRPDAYNEDLIYYVTDEQFGYVAYLQGMMVREKPAACFYMGAFFAESLILAETGNSIGAIQIAGTAQPAQLPFFVAACDYTLIGEEFFAASAYLSGSPEELGSLKGQDVGKVVVAIGILAGVALLTLGSIVAGPDVFERMGDFLKSVVLS